MHAEQAKPTYRFGAFELDQNNGQLRKHGIRLKLQQQPLLILGILLECAGEVVSREEIQKRLWPGDTYVDFDNAINSAVRKLREALGEEADAPKYIETLSRRGYRFIAPVSGRPMVTEPALESCRLASEPPRAHFSQRSNFGKWTVIVSTAVTLALTGAGLGTWLISAGNRNGQDPLFPSPLTSYPGFQITPSISPEATRVMFAWRRPGEDDMDLFVKLIGSGEPIRVSTAGGLAPAWSPDGGQVAFLRSADPLHASVIVIPALGGPEREITRVNFMSSENVRFGGWSTPPPFLVWSKDGKWLLAVDQNLPGYSTPSVVSNPLR